MSNALLGRHCSGIWRLTSSGDWVTVHRDESTDGEVSTTAELLASICATHLQLRDQVTIKFGKGLLLAEVDEQGVVVGAKESGGNPVMIRTAMNRLEATRSRGIASGLGPSTSRSREHRATAAHPEPLPGDSLHFASYVSEVEEVTPTTDSWTEDQFDRAFAPPTSDGLDQASEGLQFDIEFMDEPSEVIATGSARLQAGCSWETVADFLEMLLVTARSSLGRMAGANYFREALDESPALADWITVSIRGEVRPEAPDVSVGPEQIGALDELLEAWLWRCQRVAPEILNNMNAIRVRPWLQQEREVDR